jgi:chemotaxis protein methyltransferase CheR
VERSLLDRRGAYTIAMVLDDFAQAHGGPDYAILATDLDTNVLATAHKGIYPREMIDPVPPRLRQRYVRMGQGARAGEARIDPACAPKWLRAAQPDGAGLCHWPAGRPDLLPQRADLFRQAHAEAGGFTPRRLPGAGRLPVCGPLGSIAGFDLPLTSVGNTIFQRS